MKLGIKLLNEHAKMPTRGSKEAACFDLYVSEDVILPHQEGVLVPTGVAMAIPEGFCVKVYGRSSMCRKGIQVSTGIVDSDFSGEVKVQAINFAPQDLADVIGVRLVDRTKGKCVPQRFSGKSRRKPLTADVFGEAA